MTAKHISNNRRALLAPISIALIIGTMVYLSRQLIDPRLYTAITLDLLVVMPLIHFLIIRPTSVPKTTVVPVFILGIITASYVLPSDHQGLLSIAKSYVLPIVELLVLGYVGTKVYRAIRKLKSTKTKHIDMFQAIQTTCNETMPERAARFVSAELGMLYYCLLSWRAKAPQNGFTYHRKNGSIALLAVLAFIIVVEVFVMHILIERWSVLVAWILTGLSIYSLLQVISIIRSIYLRPTIVTDQKLLLRYGYMKECEINLNEIKNITTAKRIKLDQDSDIVNFNLLGEMESPNVLIECHQPQTIKGPYSITKESKTVAITIDNAETFVTEVERRLSSPSI